MIREDHCWDSARSPPPPPPPPPLLLLPPRQTHTQYGADGICAGFLALTEVYMRAVTANTSLPWHGSAVALSARTTLVVCRNDIYGAIYSVIFQSCIATLKHIIAHVSARKTSQIKLYSATVLDDSPSCVVRRPIESAVSVSSPLSCSSLLSFFLS